MSAGKRLKEDTLCDTLKPTTHMKQSPDYWETLPNKTVNNINSTCLPCTWILKWWKFWYVSKMFYSLSCRWRKELCLTLLTCQWLHIRSIYTNLVVWILTILHNLQVIIQWITQEGCILPEINAKWERILQLIEQLLFCVTVKWTTAKSSRIFRFCNLKTVTKHF